MPTEIDAPSAATVAPITRLAQLGVWALPIYSALLVAGTRTEQPDYRVDFAGYAHYITTPSFLASHLVASIGGTVFGILGFVSLWVLTARGRHVGLATVGGVASIAGSVFITSIFGAAAYAQPAIGRAFLAGGAGLEALNNDVYGTPLFAVALLGLLLFIVGGLTLGLAVARSDRRLRGAGIAYALLLPLFSVSGLMFDGVQWLVALALTVATLVLAWQWRQLGRADVAGTTPAG